MKHFALIPLLLLAACSSHRHIAAPEFKKDVTCSAESIAYLNSKGTSGKSSLSEDVKNKMKETLLSLAPEIRNCMNVVPAFVKGHKDFNLCLITGYDKRGKQEYFKFSTNEIILSDSFANCLQKLSSLSELKELKNVTIIQPFYMHATNP